MAGDFYINNDIIYYVLKDKLKLYTINIYGTDREKADEDIFTDRFINYTGIWLNFYTDHILVHSCTGIEIPAMVGINGENYVDFPDGLEAYAFEVINWDESTVFFKTNDGYWIYRAK